MELYNIPLQEAQVQRLTVILSGQRLDIRLRQQYLGLFADIDLDRKIAVRGMLCQDGIPLIRHAYIGFKGLLFFADSQGTADPHFSGFNDRFFLYYLDETPV